MAASLTRNPFVKKDPNIRGELSGPAAGVGARLCACRQSGMSVPARWKSPTAAPATMCCMHLLMQACSLPDNQVTFTLTPEGGGTA